MDPTDPSTNAAAPSPRSMFHRLMDVIEDRRDHPPEKSYTTTLFAGGLAKIGKKTMEEAAELIEAAGQEGTEGRQETVYEAADLLYHAFVLLAHRRIRLDEVEAELARRFGISGVDEKAARTQKGVGAWSTVRVSTTSTNERDEPAD